MGPPTKQQILMNKKRLYERTKHHQVGKRTGIFNVLASVQPNAYYRLREPKVGERKGGLKS
jgi:hypothetical protein